MMQNKLFVRLIAAILFSTIAGTGAFAQTESDKTAEIESKVDGVTERTSTLESSVAKLTQLKITGYVQPQWQWVDADSLANQVNSRNAFTIRRGRVKFAHSIPIEGTSGSIGAVIYPDITENGLILKEVYATWNLSANKVSQAPEFAFQMGAMNRPFGYEIGYSSSAREVAERTLFENRFFNGERDLGLQFAYSPTVAGITPLFELGLFNGTDNFGTGPSGALPGANNKMGFTPLSGTSSAAIGSGTYILGAGVSDSSFKASVNSAVAKETGLTLNTVGGLPGGTTGAPIGQPAKEFIGHFRLPFILSDAFSFDIGASLSMGGITEPSNVIGKYTGTNGALVLDNSGTHAGHSFTNQNLTFMQSNRSIVGVDGQFYLSVLPFGGTILKGEYYGGQVPFYGSAFLFTKADSAALGAPLASTIYKNVLGLYGMLVQNIGDNYQIAVRYEIFDPNTDVKGTDFVIKNSDGSISSLRGVAANSNLGGDLAVNTVTVALNAFVGGSLRLMFNFDHPMTEQFTRKNPTVATDVQSVSDAHDDRFTLRMQYKF